MGDEARGHLAMAVFAALVAGSFPLGALAANLIAPAALNALRFAIAAALIGGVALASTGLPREAFRAPWRYAVLGGLFAVYFVLMFEGLKTARRSPRGGVHADAVADAAIGWPLLGQRLRHGCGGFAAGSRLGAVWVIFAAICRPDRFRGGARRGYLFCRLRSRTRFTRQCSAD